MPWNPPEKLPDKKRRLRGYRITDRYIKTHKQECKERTEPKKLVSPSAILNAEK